MTALKTLFIALSLPLTACATAIGTDGTSAPAAPQLQRFTSDAGGFDTHSFWIDTGAEVVVFDAQFTEAIAQQLLTEIQAATDSPVRWVVVTHPNPDKYNGVAVFQRQGARVVASEATRAAIPGVHAYKKAYFVGAGMFTEATYPAEAQVDDTFSGRHQLDLAGDLTIELVELAHSGVSSTQTVAWIPATSDLIVGDLVHHGTHAWLEGGIVDGAPQPDLSAWKSTLAELLSFEGATVHGGRGESAPVADAVASQTDYLDQIQTLVDDYLAGLDPAELADPTPHFAPIAEQAAARFPERALAYLVDYGVYGLVLASAARLR